ncbi:NAC domain-containing protein 35-like isoform X2 [Pistacia vera]|uniref:NAC domain-containing protein 35-like isoform X2 n=1 Tax=Pistacia vera TaxID=55513 RepID=UPI0012632295|nr:NAC domain-containing protein 35-like isoform X2 [Pistacia vera]
MAIANASMSNNNNSNNNNTNKDDDDDHHEQDMVMPGFRFHPTEEELVEFYLRRKVEGKRFNVELITFLDLYRYDPWELPALAAIGEKEWFFYVPRDRKYRNGDRPNRVTTSGYWKATGADRMIRSESSRSIGLKKTLVFYSGKAPKGIRTSWIMNEYRLPQHETERYQKAEISLCRVYKRAGVEDHPSLPRSLPTRASSSSSSRSFTPSNKYPQEAAQHLAMERFQTFGTQSHNSPQLDIEKMSETDGSTSSDVTTVLGLSKQNVYRPTMVSPISASLGLPSSIEEEGLFLHQSKQVCSSLVPTCTTLFPGGSSSVSSNPAAATALDEFHRLLTYQQASINQQQQQQQPYNFNHHSQFSSLQPHQVQAAPLGLNTLTASLPTAALISDRLWEWNPIPEANREYSDPFK